MVDDQPEQLGALFAELQLNGYSLLISRNSAEAFKILTRFQPDIILMDVRLPDTDGFEVCRRLKRDEGLRNIPVLFTTGVSELDGKLEGFRAGGADYITKPFQLEEVLARIGTHMTVRRLQRALEEEKERFKGLSDATLEGILFHDRGRIVEVNRSLERMFGYCREEMTKRDVRDLLAPEFGSVSDELAVSEEERVFEARGLRKDGTEIALEIQNRPVRYRDRSLQVVALRDISWRKALERETRQLASENIVLKASLSKRDRLGELVGSGPAMQKAYERLLKAAVTDAPVIVYGETGAGKELAARTIWQLSEKYSKVFVPVNCAAVQEPLFESQFFGYRKGAFTGATRDQPGFFDRAKDGTLFPGRGRRTESRHAGKAPAGLEQRRIHSGGRHEIANRGRAHYRRLEPAASNHGRKRKISRRLVSPAACHRHRDAAASSAHGGHSAADRPFPRHSRPAGRDKAQSSG